jgi:hypothetical protein
MPLPSSGPLSIANIKNEGVAGGCYPAESPYSLGLLATAFGIPTNPDSISEFYGRSCPSAGTNTVNLYARTGLTVFDTAYIYTFDFSSGAYIYRGEVSNTNCNFITSFTTSAANLFIGLTHASPDGEIDITFNAAANTTICPPNESNYCFGTYGAALNSGTTNIAITAYVNRFGNIFEECSINPNPQ